MASDNSTPAITPAKIGFFLSLVAVATVGWNIADYLKNQELKDVEQDQRITGVEGADVRLNDNLNKLANKTEELNESVVRLTTVLEQAQMKDRAEFFFENRPRFASERP